MTSIGGIAVAQAIVEQIKAASMSWTPVLVMVGDLSYYPENATIGQDIPAVFVQPITLDIAHLDIGGESIGSQMVFRVVLCDSWDETDNMTVIRGQRLEELVDRTTIRDSGDGWRLSGTAGSLVIEQAMPARLEYAPEEHAAVAELQAVGGAGGPRRVFAAAFTLQVIARAER